MLCEPLVALEVPLFAKPDQLCVCVAVLVSLYQTTHMKDKQQTQLHHFHENCMERTSVECQASELAKLKLRWKQP